MWLTSADAKVVQDVKTFLPEITLLVELCTQSPLSIWVTWVGIHSCLDNISALRLLWRPTRDTANSVAVYAMHVSQIFEGLRGVVDAIFLAISSDHGVACEPQVAGIVDASSILLARIDDGSHAFDVADGNIFKYVQIVNKQFSPSRLTNFCLPLIDLRTYQDMRRKDARPSIMRELRGLHTHMVFVSSVLEQIRISVNFMTDRFSGDKLANLRQLPEGEQRRLSEGMRQITRWLAREADSWREVVQDIGYQEEGYWRVGPQPSLVAASEQTAYSVSSRESNPRRRLKKTGCSRNRQCRTRSSSMCTKQL